MFLRLFVDPSRNCSSSLVFGFVFSCFSLLNLGLISNSGACYFNSKTPSLSWEKPDLHHRMPIGIGNCPCSSPSSRKHCTVSFSTKNQTYMGILIRQNPQSPSLAAIKMDQTVLLYAGVEIVQQSRCRAVKQLDFSCVKPNVLASITIIFTVRCFFFLCNLNCPGIPETALRFRRKSFWRCQTETAWRYL